MNRNHNENYEEFGDALAQYIERFESMLKNNESQYLDELTYESICNFYMQKEKWGMAGKACQLGLEQFPYSLELILNYVQLQIRVMEFDKAIEMLDRAATFFPSDQEAIYWRGVVYNLMGEYDEAIEVFENALYSSDQKDEIEFQLGLAYQNKNEFMAAIAHYKRAIRYGYVSEMVFCEFVFCAELGNSLEEGRSYFRSLTDEDPYSALAWFGLGITCQRMGLMEEAIRAFEFATVITDDFASAWFSLADCYLQAENFEKAAEAYLKTEELEEPTAELYTNLGTIAEKMENYGEAYQYYRKAVDLEDTWNEAWFGMASVLYEQERFLEAVHFAQKAIGLYEASGDYWLLLGDVEAKIGNLLSSHEAYARAAQLDAENIDIWLNWSLLYFEQGTYGKAIEILEKGMGNVPVEADIYYRMAVYLIFNKQYNQGCKFLQEALVLDFDGHEQLYSFFTNLQTQKALNRVIEQNRP